MRIAINTRFLLKDKMEGFGWFTYETVSRIVLNHPEHEFFFFFDRPFDPKFIFADNVTPVVLNPQARRPILFKIWFNFSVTRALKKYKIDCFFSPDGYLSLKTEVPQIGVIHDLNFEHFPEDLPGWAHRYLKKFTPLFAKKAAHIITVSAFSKQDIIETYHIPEEKITIAYNGASPVFKPVSTQEKQQTKDKFSDGQEYFLFVGALHPRKNLKRLAQAYDQFRKSGTSTTKLVVVGTPLWRNDETKAIFDSLQFREDIIFTGHLSIEQLANVTASAKAMVFVSYFEGFGIPLVEAMQSACPIIAGNKTALPEIAGDAALLVDPFNIDEISEALMTLDQNAEMREELIEKGLERSKDFSWDKTAEIISKVLFKAQG